MPCVHLGNTFAHWQDRHLPTYAEFMGITKVAALAVTTPRPTLTIPAAITKKAKPSIFRKKNAKTLKPANAYTKSPQISKSLKASHSTSPQRLAETGCCSNSRQPAETNPQPRNTAKSTKPSKTTLKVPHIRKSRRTLSLAKPPRQPNVNLSRPAVRLTRADLINAESKLGSTIFGPIPEGHRREFFHDRQNIWIWHEDWYDGQRNPHQMTIRYEVRTSGIYKKVSTGQYFKLEGDELENFRKATKVYLQVIKKNLYQNLPQHTKTA